MFEAVLHISIFLVYKNVMYLQARQQQKHWTNWLYFSRIPNKWLIDFFLIFCHSPPKIVHFLFAPTDQQLFGDADVFQQYGIPMNPADNTTIPGLDDRQRQQNDGASNTATSGGGAGNVQNSITGNELISYQQPIDFTDFLNIDENDLALNASGSFATNK